MSDSTAQKNPTFPSKGKRLFFIFFLLIAACGIIFFYLKDEEAQNQTFSLIQKIKNVETKNLSSIPTQQPHMSGTQEPLMSLVPVLEQNQPASILPEEPEKTNTPLIESVENTPLSSSPSTEMNINPLDNEIDINHTQPLNLTSINPKSSDNSSMDTPSEEEQSRTKELSKQSTQTHALLIALRDDFMLGRSCTHSFQQAMGSVQPTEAQKIAATLSSFCLQTKPVYSELESIFQQNKTKALRVFYRELDPSWKGYMKSFFLSLVQVRNLSPAEERVENILDHAQLALEDKQIEETLRLLQQLPPLSQKEMHPYIQYAEQYIEAKKMLDDLILKTGV